MNSIAEDIKRRGRISGPSKLHRVVREFRKLNPDMTLQAVEVFMLIARDEGTSISAIVKQTGISLGGGSCHVAYLGSYDRNKKPGLGLVEQKEVLEDRRTKELKLTSRGRMLRDSLVDILGDR